MFEVVFVHAFYSGNEFPFLWENLTKCLSGVNQIFRSNVQTRMPNSKLKSSKNLTKRLFDEKSLDVMSCTRVGH